MFRRIEEGTTTVHDSGRLKRFVVGVALVGIAAGIVIGVLLVL